MWTEWGLKGVVLKGGCVSRLRRVYQLTVGRDECHLPQGFKFFIKSVRILQKNIYVKVREVLVY